MTIADGAPTSLTAIQRARTAVLDPMRNLPERQDRSVDPDSMARLSREAAAVVSSGQRAQAAHDPDIETARAAADLPTLKPGQAHDGGSRGAAANRAGQAPGKQNTRPGVGE